MASKKKEELLQPDVQTQAQPAAQSTYSTEGLDRRAEVEKAMATASSRPSQQVTDACHKHGGFYLGSIGGPAAVLAQQSIKSLECVAYPELGMEAIWKIEVEDFPAFILVDDKGNDFFQQIQNKQCAGCKQHG